MAHAAELARDLAPYVLQRLKRDVLPELPALTWEHVPVRPDQVPVMPELTIEERAILHKLERGETISRIEEMHLSTLRRWVGVAKAPAVVAFIDAVLEGTDKVVVFAVHRSTIAGPRGRPRRIARRDPRRHATRRSATPDR